MLVERQDGCVWHPSQGSLDQPYRFRYIKGRDYHFRGAAAGLLYTQILDRPILDWLSGFPPLWASLLYVLAGQYERAGVLDELAEAVIQEAYFQGVSKRSVDELVKAMGMTGISKSQVSRLAGEIDERIHAFLDHPLEGDWPYLWIDATYVKVREARRIVSIAVIIAVAVNTDGGREVLGMRVGPSEAELSAQTPCAA